MIPIQIKIKNFLCFRDVPAVNFEGIHVACLCGENGAGKSSVFDAITYALWGETSRGRGDDLIHSGQNDMSVELEFLSGTNRYLIIRKQVRGTAMRSGKSALDIQILDNGEYRQLSEALKRETQAAINNLLHLDYDTFINSAMILQGRSNEFSKKRPGERKEILANILDLSFYDQLEQQARDLADKNKSDAAILERDLQALQEKVGDQALFEQEKEAAEASLDDIVAGKEAADKRAADLRGRRDAMSAKSEQVTLLAGQISAGQKRLDGLQKRLKETEASIQRLGLIIKGKDVVEGLYSNCQQQLNINRQKLSQSIEDVQTLKTRVDGLLVEIQELSDRKTRLSGNVANCPLCESELGEDGCIKLRDKLTAAMHGKISQRTDFEMKLIEARVAKTEIEDAIARDEVALRDLETRRTAVATAAGQLENELAGQFDLIEDIEAARKEIADLTAKHGAVKAEISGLDEILTKLKVAEIEAADYAGKERKIREVITRADEKLRQIDEYSMEIDQKTAALAAHKEDESIYSELSKYFGKRGIQALIIEETLPEIEAEANLLLDKMTDGRMSLTIETQKDTKKGATIETLDIKIADELGMRPYEMFSGGEAYRIDLALRIAISRLLVRRAGASMPILIIDEGFGTQDSAGIEKLVEAINSIQDDFEKVFVITHLDELKDRFPALITVNKGPDGSVISMN
jgi:DNA repair exonuclease SbcCD ATPase subunit